MTRLQKNVSVFQGGGGQMTPPPLPLPVGAHERLQMFIAFMAQESDIE